MPVAEIGKEYTYNGKKYVACKAKKWQPCNSCDLYKTVGCVQPMRNGMPHTCIDSREVTDLIFVEVKEDD